MNKLVKEIIKPLLEDTNIKKVVGIYGGRFQPFGPHHLKTYKWLAKQVDDAYITTSNIKKPPRHPMNFKEKIRHMSKMGVPSNKIIEEKSPYVAKNLAKKYDEETTVFVYVFGAKDAGRLGGSGKYFQDYKKNKKNLKGHKHHGYYLVAPHVSMNVGGKEVSGTSMRELLGSPKLDDKERVKLFKKMFGYYNKGIFNMLVNKFKKLFEDTQIPWDNTKQMPLKKKFKDGKKKELLQDLEIDLNIGDTVLMGKFKNKKVVVKSIDWNEKGDLLINGRPAFKFRILKKGGVNEKIDYKKALKKLKIPPSLLHNKQKLVNYFTTNPQILTQLLRLIGEEKINESKKEFVIWGIAPGKSSEEILYTKAKSQGEAKKIIKILVSKHGVKKARIQVLDLTQDPSKFWKSDNMFGEDVNVVKKDGKDGGDYRDYDSEKDSDWEEPYKLDDGYPNEEDMKKIIKRVKKARNKTDSNKEYQFDKIEEFLMTIDMNNIIKEATHTSLSGKQAVDSGPNMFMGGVKGYVGRNHIQAEKLGWEVINYVLNVDSDNVPPSKYEMLDGWPMGPHNSVTYLPAGAGTGKTANNQENLHSGKGYAKWLRAIRSVATEVGYKLLKFTKRDKELRKQIAKDSKETIKQQKKEETLESFTKDWWKDLLKEKIVTKNRLQPRRKELLLMGGAYGHMAHPFDDKNLTFGDLKKIIEDGLGGNLSREDNVTEKLDGQNIMVSWKDGKLIAARNKGHIKNGGKTALDAKGIASKFAGRGDIKNAFTFAMKDLEKAIKGLSQKQKDKIFNNGYNFMNMEVMWPKSSNVIDYDKAELVFHGALIYDDTGNVKGEVPGSGRILAGMIKQINQHIQKKYKIGKPVFLDVPKHQDFGKMKKKFLGKLSKLQSQFGLKDNDTLALYHQSYWERFIINGVFGKNFKVPPKVLKGLTKRWAFFDKSYSVADIKKDIKEEHILKWVLDFDKKDHAKWVKDNMKPFEELFFEVGAEILKNVKGFMAANPDKAVQGIRKKLDSAIADVRKGGDIKKLNKLSAQLSKLQTIGGTKAIVPSEGIVFKYKGKTYKFTGAFAPINQITGLISF